MGKLDKRDDSMHIGGSITDELRAYAGNFYLFRYKDVREKLDAIADLIDAEHMRQLEVLYRDMSDAEWVRLPLDADGVPIRIGDAMVLQHEVKEKPYVVQSFTWDGEDWYFTCDEGFFNACGWEHYHAPTVEDVLREFADEWRDADAKTVEKFAAKLRLAGDAQ